MIVGVPVSIRARRGDKQRRKRLLLLWLCIISLVRWPTVEMSCNYSHSYFPPSLFSVARLWFCFPSFCWERKTNTRRPGSAECWRVETNAPFDVHYFCFLLLLSCTRCVWRGSRPLEEIWCDKSVSFFGHIIMPVIYFFPLRIFVSFGCAWTVSLGLP